MDILFNSIGIFGVALVLGAYFLVTKGKVTGQHMSYQLMNLFGAIFVLISLFHEWNLPSFVYEVCWIGISIFGIYRIMKNRL